MNAHTHQQTSLKQTYQNGRVSGYIPHRIEYATIGDIPTTRVHSPAVLQQSCVGALAPVEWQTVSQKA